MIPNQAIVQATGILKRFGPTEVLKGVDFTAYPGEIHALLGGNGAGKSTMIKIITGLLQRDGGELSIAGEARSLHAHETAPSNLIAVVHQEMALLPHLTVAENIVLPKLNGAWQKFAMKDARIKAHAALALIDSEFADRALDRRVETLSLHEKQLVEIARTLDSGARLLLLDEPTANLTASESERLFDVLRRLVREKSICIVFVSHRMREIRQIADVCSILRNGVTVVNRQAIASLTDADIVERMGQGSTSKGNAVKRAHTADAFRAAANALHLACGDFSYEVPCGSVLGLAGAPAGPSALIDQLVGAVPSGPWRVQHEGMALAPQSPKAALQRGIGFVSGDRANKGVLHSLPITDNLMASRRVQRGQFWVRADEFEVCRTLIEGLKIKGSPSQLPRALSGGTQQKLLIARWTGLAPKILVLEEPTRGVDIGTKREIYGQIRALAAKGTTVVWWSTESVELAEVCDYAIAFDPDGRPTRALRGDDISDESLADATGMVA